MGQQARSGIWRVEFAVGLGVALLGLTVMTGWYSGIGLLVQIVPGFAPMQHNAALAFVLCGSGLLLMARRRSREAGICSLVAALIGLATLFQYIFNINLGIDQFFLRPEIVTATSHPGRMAPNAAVAFALFGSALAWQAFRPGRERSWASGLMGVATTALGLVALLGYAAGIEQGYGWGRLTRMAIHTAAGFAALGTGLVALAWRTQLESLQKGLGIRFKVAALVCASTLVTGGAVWVVTYQEYNSAVVERELSESRLAASAIASRLTAHIESLRQDLQILPGTPAAQGFIRASRSNGIDPIDGLSQSVWQRRLAEVFANVMETEPGYTGIHLIGLPQATELIGVERGLEGIQIASPSSLANERHDAIREAHWGLRPKTVEIVQSPRLGSAGQPGRFLRAALSIQLPSGQPFGVILIRRDLDNLFRELLSLTAEDVTLALANPRGEFLFSGPSSAPSDPSVLRPGQTSTIRQAFPELEKVLYSGAQVEFAYVQEMLGNRRVVGFHKVPFDAHNPGNFMAVILHSSYQEAFRDSIATRNKSLALVLLALAIFSAAGLLVARSLTRPLRRMASAVQAVGRGGQAPDLPLEATDEVGLLANSFQEMLQQVNARTEQLKSEVDRRAEAEERLNLALKSSGVGTWSWNLKEGSITWDDYIHPLFGLAPGSFSGRYDDFAALVHPEDRQRVNREVSEAVEGGKGDFQTHYRVIWPDGRIRSISARGRVYRDFQGELLRMTGVCWDITERMQFEEALKARNQDLETLLHVTSHDLKEPLRAIGNFSRLVLERYSGNLEDKAKDFLRRVERAGQRLDRLLADILVLSRAQRMDTRADEVDGKELIEEAIRNLEDRIQESEAQVSVQGPFPIFRVNRGWAARAVYNLISNALKFTREGESAQVEIIPYSPREGEPAEIGICVRDRGPGVKPEHAQRIFMLFQRAVGRDVEGTGAGLAIVKQVAQRHDGHAWLRQRQGGGSEFIITFGFEASATSHPAPRQETLDSLAAVGV